MLGNGNHFINWYEFIGPMRLGNRARAEQHRLHTDTRQMAAITAKSRALWRALAKSVQ